MQFGLLFKAFLAGSLFAFATAAQAKKEPPQEYEGENAGYLVYSVGTIDDTPYRFSFSYRPTILTTNTKGVAWAGQIEPRLSGAFKLKVKNPDYTGNETGHVIVRRLPPGKYEVFDFDFATHALYSGTSYYYSSGVPFSLPFTIRRGEATYVGRFMRWYDGGKSIGSAMRAIGPFIVADRSSTDFSIAKGRFPMGVPFKIEVTDVSKFRSPVLLTKKPVVSPQR